MQQPIGIILFFFFLLEINSKQIIFSHKKPIDRSEDRTITKLFNKFQNRLSTIFSKKKLKIHQHHNRGKAKKQGARYDQLPIYGNHFKPSSALQRKSLGRDARNMRNKKQGTRKEFEPKYATKVLTEGARLNPKEVKAYYLPPTTHLPPPPKINEDSYLELISVKRAHNPVLIPISPSFSVSPPSFHRKNISTVMAHKQNIQPKSHQERERPNREIRSEILKEGRYKLKHKPAFRSQAPPSPHKPVEMIAPGIGVNEQMIQFVQLNHTPMEMESNSEWK